MTIGKERYAWILLALVRLIHINLPTHYSSMSCCHYTSLWFCQHRLASVIGVKLAGEGSGQAFFLELLTTSRTYMIYEIRVMIIMTLLVLYIDVDSCLHLLPIS